jgi:hypothetical protein
MRRLLGLTLIAFVIGAVPARAAIAFVQETTNSGTNDITLTFGGAMGANNHILVLAMWSNESVTADLTSITNAEVQIAGYSDSPGVALRGSIWCFQGDGSDTTVTIDLSGGANIWAAAIEVSGGSCTEDGTDQSNDDATETYSLTTDVTTTVNGSLLVCFIKSTSVSDYAADSPLTAIPASGADIGTVALGGYVITGTAGAQDCVFSSNGVNETSFMLGAAVQAAAAASPVRSLLTLGVGE